MNNKELREALEKTGYKQTQTNETKAPKKSMADYVKRSETESKIIRDAKKHEIDNQILEYIQLKEYIKTLEANKKLLEGQLDAMVSEDSLKLEGNKYVYKFKTSEYDKIISKTDAIKAGVYQKDFLDKGYVTKNVRKVRVIEEL